MNANFSDPRFIYVLAAYGVSLFAFVGLLTWSVLRLRRWRRAAAKSQNS